MKTVFYWRGIVGDVDLLSNYKRQIDRLLSGDYKGLSLEKLHGVKGPSIFSIRVNDATRLLFTTYKGNICLLSEVLNHKYESNPFLKDPQVLKAFLAKVGASFDIKIEEKLVSSSSSKEELENELGKPDGTDVNFMPVDYYKQQFITLNTHQNQALHAKLPAIVYGSAGSGKTLVALAMLQDYLLAQGHSLKDPILYVSQSPQLVKEMRDLWQNTVSPGNEHKVVFMTYEDILKKQLPKDYALAQDSQTFKKWFAQIIKQAKYKHEANMPASEEVWREFRILSGYGDEQAYIKLGGRQSSLIKEQRLIVCELYRKYLDELKAGHLISAELSSLLAQDKYSLVVADEAQDFSYGQLKNLHGLAHHEQIVYLLGDHQILFDGKSRLSYLRYLLNTRGKKAQEVELPSTYRCPQLVVEVANRLIALKYAVTGGKADDVEASEMRVSEEVKEKKGEIQWIDPKDLNLKALRDEAKSVHLAVVTHPEYVEQAKKELGTALVFTPEEIKGLEYETIVVWRPLDNLDCERAANLLKDLEERDLTTKNNRPKAGQGDESFLPYFNRLITAVTRTCGNLKWVQEERHNIKPISQPLRKVFNLNLKKEKTPMVNYGSSTEEWEKEARKLLQQGKETQARAIFIETLKRSEKDFQAFFQENVPASPLENETLRKAMPLTPEVKKAKQEGKATKAVEVRKDTNKTQPKNTPVSISQEERQVIKLLDDFTEKRLTLLLKLYNTGSILFTPMTLQNGSALSLFEYILNDKSKTEVFLRCLANNVVLLKTIPVVAHLHLSVLNKLPINTELLELLKKLAKIGVVFKNCPEGEIPVHLAIAKKDLEILETLHSAGADFNQISPKGSTPASVAASLEPEKECVSTLTKLHELGTNLALPNRHGWSSIFMVIDHGYLDAVKFLLTHYKKSAVTVFMSSKDNLLKHYDRYGEEVRNRLTKKIAQRMSLGDKENEISLLPIDVAEVMGFQAIVEVLKTEMTKEMVPPAMPFFKKPALKPIPERQEKKETQNTLKIVLEAFRDFSEEKLLLILKQAPSLLHLSINKGNESLSLFDHIKRDEYKVSLFIRCLVNDAILLRELAKPLIELLSKGNCSSLEKRFLSSLQDLVEIDQKFRTVKYINGDSVVHHAAVRGDIEALNILIKYGADLDKASFGGPPSSIATLSGHIEVLVALANHGVNLKKEIGNGANLLYAAAEGGHDKVIHFLLDQGLEINQANARGATPVYIACQNGNLAALMALADRGADLNKVNQNGTAPAHIAAFGGHVDILAELYKRGADFKAHNNKDMTPLLVAAEKNQIAVFDLFSSLGLDLNERNKHGDTAAYIAAEYNRVEAIEKLYALKADLNIPNIDGDTPLHVAVEEDNVLVVSKLLQLGAQHCQNEYGETPAYLAARHGKVSSLLELIKSEVDLNVPNNFGATPIFIAAQNGHVEAVKILLSGNAIQQKAYISKQEDLLKFCDSRDEKIRERMQLKINERLQCGENDDAISLFPVDIAEVMGYEAIVELLNSKAAEPMAYSSSAFFKQNVMPDSNTVISLKGPGGL